MATTHEPGQKFHRLTLVSPVGRGRYGEIWRVRCDCGTEKDMAAYILRAEKVISCGCARVGKPPVQIEVPPEAVEVMRDMREAGATWMDICRKTGYSRAVVVRISDTYGFRRREKVEPPPTLMKRSEAGAEPLPPFHEIAAAVLEEARRIRF